MAVETTKPKKLVLAISLVVFIGGTAITYAIFGNPAFSVVASSLTLALWLSVGLLLNRPQEVLAFERRPQR